MKKLLITAGILFSVLWICLFMNHITNEKLISNYEDGIYEKNDFTFFGFFEPYIAHYNQGNIEYQNKNYEKAIEEYQKAINCHMPEDQECLARINIALAMVIPIDEDEINSQNIDETIKKLEEASDILTEKGCAHEHDSNGHNPDAQQLKEDIDDFIERLKEQKEEGSDDDSQNPHQSGNAQNGSDGDDKKQQLEEIQQQTQKEREEEIAITENIGELYNYDYGGACW